MRRAVGPIVVVLAACGCGGFEVGTEGMLVYSDGETGNLLVQDVESGNTKSIASDGPFGTIYLSHDGTQVAFTAAFDVGRDIFVASIDGGGVTTISPLYSELPARVTWSPSGWFWYYGGENHQLCVVTAGADQARVFGEPQQGTFGMVASPVEDMLAYGNLQLPVAGYVYDLIVERSDGSDSRTIATGIEIQRQVFTPDGTALVTGQPSQNSLEQGQVVLRPIAGGEEVVLGPGGLAASSVPGTSPFSPDGTEVLGYYDYDIHALAVDGSGGHLVHDGYSEAGFIPTGAILFSGSTTVISDEGGLRTLNDDAGCGSHVSPSGQLIAYGCTDGTVKVQRIADGDVLYSANLASSEFSITSIIGFTSDEDTVLFWREENHVREIWRIDLDGDHEMIGTVATSTVSGSASDWPFVAYRR
jgi:hypothetical protein